MRAPFRSESDAYRFTLGGAAIVAVSLVIGIFGNPWVGLGVFGLAVVVAAGRYSYIARRDRAPVLEEAAEETFSPESARRRRHVLVVANEALAGKELRTASSIRATAMSLSMCSLRCWPLTSTWQCRTSTMSSPTHTTASHAR